MKTLYNEVDSKQTESNVTGMKHDQMTTQHPCGISVYWARLVVDFLFILSNSLLVFGVEMRSFKITSGSFETISSITRSPSTVRHE